jgi:hypothetical protein
MAVRAATTPGASVGKSAQMGETILITESAVPKAGRELAGAI